VSWLAGERREGGSGHGRGRLGAGKRAGGWAGGDCWRLGRWGLDWPWWCERRGVEERRRCGEGGWYGDWRMSLMVRVRGVGLRAACG
jgi:hypothetical protein